MTAGMDEVFEYRINNHVGKPLVAVAQVGINVLVYGQGRKAGAPASIAPAEAREMAAALIRVADKADEKQRGQHGATVQE